MRRPLDGIIVLSFELQVAGPYCSMMLADQGATVLKIEQPGAGDSARGGAPLLSNDSGELQSGYFLRFNRNKKSVTLDVKSAAGRTIFAALARRADILVDNYRPGLLQDLGLGYDNLSKANRGLIYVSISGFGSSESFAGPFSRRPAYDIVAQAMGGLMFTCGSAGGPPTWLGVALGDIVSGMNAAFGALVALRGRELSGLGQYVDVSMYDTAIALGERSVSAYSLAGTVLERGNEPYMAPWGAFECRDGWVALIVATERDWKKFCIAIDRRDLVERDGARSGPERAANMHDWLGVIVRDWFGARTTSEACQSLLDAGLPVGPVQNAREIYDCPHVEARRLLIDVPDPILGSVRLVGPPVKLSEHPGARTEAVPLLGEHTDEVLQDLLQLEESELTSLRAQGVI